MLLVPTVLLTVGVVYCQMHYAVDALAGLASVRRGRAGAYGSACSEAVGRRVGTGAATMRRRTTKGDSVEESPLRAPFLPRTTER